MVAPLAANLRLSGRCSEGSTSSPRPGADGATCHPSTSSLPYNTPAPDWAQPLIGLSTYEKAGVHPSVCLRARRVERLPEVHGGIPIPIGADPALDDRRTGGGQRRIDCASTIPTLGAWEPSLIVRSVPRERFLPRPRGNSWTDQRSMDGDDSYAAAVESIANKEWERNAKPRRGVPGGLPPGKAGEAPVGRRSVCPNQLCL